jgi:phage terminase large subunit-like protein
MLLAADEWRTWLVLGGRGSGKTRAGAEWVRALATGSVPVGRIALVAETLNDARAIMVEGNSGLMAVHPLRHRPTFEPTKRQLTWPNGAIAQLFSAEDPESLRGPQFEAAWCDELAKWKHAQAAWDMLQFGLRLGERPRQVVTTTPRPIPLLKAIMDDPATRLTHAPTRANARNLAASFLAEIERRYAGTRLGRQELEGELIEDRSDALWKREWIELGRMAEIPELGRIVVAVDPGVTSGVKANASGIVAAGLGEGGRAYVLADRTLAGYEPEVWAHAAVKLYRELAADCLVFEANQGGELVAMALRRVDENVALKAVTATRGKWLRAEPVAALYAQGRVSHVGLFPELEDEMADFGPDGLSSGRSPDRLDALVWALTELMLGGPGPGVRVM